MWRWHNLSLKVQVFSKANQTSNLIMWQSLAIGAFLPTYITRRDEIQLTLPKAFKHRPPRLRRSHGTSSTPRIEELLIKISDSATVDAIVIASRKNKILFFSHQQKILSKFQSSLNRTKTLSIPDTNKIQVQYN